MIQINLRDEVNLIFINESLLLSEKEDLRHLIQKYIDVFPWNYEDMPRLIPQVVMHHFNINPDVNLVNNSNNGSVQK